MAVWAAAWSSSIDPDMYQVYHKDSTATSTKNWGYDEIYKDLDRDQFGDEQDIINELSLLIESARQTNNKTDRSKDYAKALDLVMELAVELPTYQRHDLFAYNSECIDVNTLNQDATWTSGVIAKIWELNYYQQ
jgi:peptide/nickel transport system substrate-binding protein